MRNLYIQGLSLLRALLSQLNQPDHFTSLGSAGWEIALSTKSPGQLPVVFRPGRGLYSGHNFLDRLTILDGRESA